MKGSLADTVGAAISHYRVLEQIGAGGMGVVYRARDEQLERDVAIKVLPAGMLAEETARHRFRREALSLARLNHPNVATVYEFGNDKGTDFLVTEYIPGETLEDKLAEGALPSKEAVGLGIQLAQGLAAAHEQGIVHRDLKPANLRLTADGRLKILDFGLAQFMPRASGLGLTATMSQSQEVSGTLPYMAPEQLRSELSDARSDIWASGAVLYEMATGQRPFPETNGPLLINAILTRNPEPPSKVNPQVPPGLESVILKALDKEPARRYQTARELNSDLERLTVGVSPLARRARTRTMVLQAAGGALVLAALALGAYFALHRRAEPPTTAITAVKARRSVAVLGFKNLSGKPELAWFSTALSEMLTTELSEGEQLRTIPGESVVQMKMSLALPDADSYGKETLARIRQNLGTDLVILGSYIPVGSDQVRLDVKLQDTTAGETLAAVSEKAARSQLDELVSKAGAELRARLGVSSLSETQLASVRATLPSNPAAARLYAEGLAKLRASDALGARDLLLKAVAEDPNHAASWAALSAAWSTLGYDAKSLEAAKRAFTLSAHLSREERLRVEGQYYEADSQLDRAIAAYKELFNSAPDNLDYGLKLANLQTFAGKANDAQATIAGFRSLPPPQRDDLRIDLAEARAAHYLSDFKREQTLAAAVAAKAAQQGARFLVARARQAECNALRNMGDPKAAIAACQEAQRIFLEAGDRYGAATALNSIGNALYDLGDLAGGKRAYEQVADLDRQIGNQGGLAGALDNIASLVGDQGDLATAHKLSQQALAIYRDTGDKINIAATLSNLGALQVTEGDLKGSRKMFAESLAIGREIGSDTNVATALVNLGDVDLQLGDPAGSRKAYEEALAIFQKTGEKGKTSYPLVGLGDVSLATGDLPAAKSSYEQALDVSRESGEKHQSAVALAGLGTVQMRQGDLAGARKSCQEALALHRELDEKDASADDQLLLARLEIEEGRPEEAEVALHGLVPAPKSPEREALARATLAELLAARGKAGEARKEIGSAAALAGKTQRPAVRLGVQISAARVRMASGHPADLGNATNSLNQIVAEARKIGLVEPQLQARLTLGIIAKKSGKGVAQLQELEKDASARGFGLVASKAAKARR
ncbi:MAG TPA: tetratricopeptide repeat protein [Terriglobales bacterium]|nr:tetratricopeptide repeat protein [Terriglobales bacterium]